MKLPLMKKHSYKARENELKERIPVPHDNFFKSIYSSLACCVGYSVTRVAYFHVNVTCFAAKHLQFDSQSAPVVDVFLISAFRS